MAGVHEDFGEKIGGAKKDLWKDRGLYVDDLDAMNDREAEKFVKKDNIWKKPDYQAMLDEGVPLGVVYFIKKARDSLNASPQYYRTDDTPEKRLARQKEYIQTVRELQEVVSGIRTMEDAMRAYDRFFVENGYLEQVQGWGGGAHYRATKKGQDNPVITNKLSKNLMAYSASYFERNFTQKAQKEQFGVSKGQKVPKGYAIHFNDGKNTYSKNNDWKPGTYYVTKGYAILQANFETREAALKWVQELAKGQTKSGKTRFVPPQLAHVKRTGPDYRSGAEITGQHYLDTFGFRGGEFGNWMNQNDRQTSLNMGFEALKDLASVLKVSDQDIAYQGTLAIAFGARGSGNAAAHYEPLRKVINLRSTAIMLAWWLCWVRITGCILERKNVITLTGSFQVIMTIRTDPCALSATSRICIIFSMGRAGRTPRRKCWSEALPCASMKILQGSGRVCFHSLRPAGKSCLPGSLLSPRKATCIMRSFTRKDRPATTICWMAG